jgi:hypothetical protein
MATKPRIKFSPQLNDTPITLFLKHQYYPAYNVSGALLRALSNGNEFQYP